MRGEESPELFITPVIKNMKDITSKEGTGEVNVEFDVPLHLRYDVPLDGGASLGVGEGMEEGMVTAVIPPPRAFWACEGPYSGLFFPFISLHSVSGY